MTIAAYPMSNNYHESVIKSRGTDYSHLTVGRDHYPELTHGTVLNMISYFIA